MINEAYKSTLWGTNGDNEVYSYPANQARGGATFRTSQLTGITEKFPTDFCARQC